jgi:hypothetical protein
MSLYAIKSEMESILDAILDGGIDGQEAQDALNAHLEGLDAALEDKADDYAGMIQSLNLRAEARKAEAARMRQLAETDAALADRLKERLKEAMEATGKLKLDTPRFKLSVAGNGGKQPLEVAVEPTALPQEFQAVEVRANKDAIRAALEAGVTVPGCTLLPRGTGLRIR